MPVNRQASGIRMLIGSIAKGDEGGGEGGRAGMAVTQLDLAADFARQLARLRQTDLLATAEAEVPAYPMFLQAAHPATCASRPIHPDEAVAIADPARLTVGLRKPVRNAFYPCNHKNPSHIGKNVGLDHVGRARM